MSAYRFAGEKEAVNLSLIPPAQAGSNRERFLRFARAFLTEKAKIGRIDRRVIRLPPQTLGIRNCSLLPSLPFREGKESHSFSPSQGEGATLFLPFARGRSHTLSPLREKEGPGEVNRYLYFWFLYFEEKVRCRPGSQSPCQARSRSARRSASSLPISSASAQAVFSFVFPQPPPAVTTLNYDGRTRPANAPPLFNRPNYNGAFAPYTLSGQFAPYGVKPFAITEDGAYDCVCDSAAPANWSNGFFIYSGAFDPDDPLANCVAGTSGDLARAPGRSVLSGLTLAPGNYFFVATAAAPKAFGSFVARVLPSPQLLTSTLLATGSTAPVGAASPTYNLLSPNGNMPPIALSAIATRTAYSAQTFDLTADANYDIKSDALPPTGTAALWNNAIALYFGGFDPNQPLARCVAASNGADNAGHPALAGLSLTAGHYVLVASGADNASVGAFKNTVSPSPTSGPPVFTATGDTTPTGGSPYFHRLTFNGDALGGPSSGYTYYSVKSFTVRDAGTYGATVQRADGTTWKPCAYLYADAFDPAQPAKNCLVGNAAATAVAGFNVALDAGTYYLVVTSSSSGSFGPFSASVTAYNTYLRLSGTTAGQPTFHSPLPNGSDAPQTLSLFETAAYQAVPFTPAFSGPAIFHAAATNPTDWYPEIFLYNGPFDAAHPLTNCQAGAYGSASDATLDVSVTAGTSYTIVTCGYYNNDYPDSSGDYSLSALGLAANAPVIAYSDALTAGVGPQFARPLPNGNAPPKNTALGLSQYYHANSFTVPVTGRYTLSSACASSALWNLCAALYMDRFDPAFPTKNCLMAVDSFASGAATLTNIMLTAGTAYCLVTTGSGNLDFGPYRAAVGAANNSVMVLTYSGATTLGAGSHLVRPDSNGDLPPVSLSATALSDYYKADSFTVPTDGLYRLTDSRSDTPNWNLFAALYQNGFDPASPTNNALLAAAGVGGTATFGPMPLKAGVNYTLVTTGLSNADFGGYALTLDALTQGAARLDASDALAQGSGPSFARPVPNGSAPPTTLTASGGYFYQDTAFSAPANGKYNFYAAAHPAGWGAFLALYHDSFNPAAPLTNCLNAAQGSDATATLCDIPLTAGTVYHLVTTSNQSGVYGDFHDKITQGGVYPPVIPDNNPSGLTAVLTVKDAFKIQSLDRVKILGLSHPFCGDLLATLTHSGVTMELFDRIGRLSPAGYGSSAQFVGDIAFAPVGADLSDVPDRGFISTMQDYAPYRNDTMGQSAMATGTFADFAGLSVAGDWTLTISDLAAEYAGDFTGFQIEVTRQTAAVSGVLSLEGIVPLAAAQTITFTFRPVSGGSDRILSAEVGPDGAYRLTGLPMQAYRTRIKGGMYLGAVLPMNLSQNALTNQNAALRTGDANGDDSCDTTDFGLLVGCYGSSADIPGSGYDPACDFNGDGFVDTTDFGLLVGNYGAQGDTL